MTRRSFLGRTAPAGGTWWAAAGLAIVVTLHLLHALPYQDVLRTLSFDVYQSIAPRQRVSAPVTIVDIDEASLQRFGQWPWPRNLMARLLDRLWAAEPAAVALDILMPEADRTSPCQITQYIPDADPKLVRSVCALPSNDQLLAAALRRGKAVVGVAGIDGEGKATVRAAPMRAIGEDPHLLMRRFDSALTNIPELQNAAAGHAVLSTDVQYGVVRKVPMVANVAGTVMPSLSLEILRLASGLSSFVVKANGGRIEGVGIKGLFIPTQADGSLWVHYGRHDPSRFVSAVRVLDGNADPALVHKKLVLIGLSGLGLIDFHATTLGERLPGVEIHAQVLESIFDGTTLLRPYWAPWVEGALMAIVGLSVLLGFPRLRARVLVPIMSFATLLLVAAGVVAYVNGHLLIDVASPISIFVVMFGFMQADLLIRGETQRKALEADLEAQREQAARTRGEMEAARRIQMGILPDVATQFANEPRLDVAAQMQPAKQVGGDLYDCFMLDEHHAFFSIGDVCGKGVPASLFMAVSKTLCKSLALRNPGRVPDPGQLMREANREISRDNSEMLFVTAVMAVLDLRDGTLRYCNAGHDKPFVLAPGTAPRELGEIGAPPLCIVEEFEYETQHHQLASGELVCLFSDGVTEAFDTSGQMYGRERLAALLEAMPATASAAGLVERISSSVHEFAAGADPSDDLTLLAFRWQKPPAL